MSSSYRVGITGDMYDKIMAVDTARAALESAPGVDVARFEHGPPQSMHGAFGNARLGTPRRA